MGSAIANFLKRQEKIMNDYGSILGKYARYPLRPQSVLPYSKEEIKAVLKTALRYEHDKSRIGYLLAGYSELASFVSDEEAELSKMVFDKMHSGENPENIVVDKEFFSEFEKYPIILRRVNEESKRLYEEIIKFCKEHYGMDFKK